MKPHFWNLLKHYQPRLQQHYKRQIINLSDLNYMGRHCMPFSEYWFNQWLLVKSGCDIITDTNWGFAGYDTAVKSNCLEIFSRMQESDVKLKSTDIVRTSAREQLLTLETRCTVGLLVLVKPDLVLVHRVPLLEFCLSPIFCFFSHSWPHQGKPSPKKRGIRFV